MPQTPVKYGKLYKKGDVIFTANQVGGTMYIIQSGKVKISIKAKSAEQVLAYLGKGEFFGEIALFTNRPRTATAVAEEDSTLLAINRDSMESLLEKNHGFAVNIIQKLCKRIQQANKKIEELLVISKDTRLLRELAKFWKQSGGKENDLLTVLKNDFIEYVNHSAGISKEEAIKIIQTLINQKQIQQSSDQKTLYFNAKIFYNNEFRT